VNIKTTM